MKNSNFTHLLWGMLLFLFVAGCRLESVERSIIILHTNDEHSRIENFARLAYLKDSLAKQCDHIFLVSAGDRYSGNPYVDKHEKPGYPIVDIMNRTGYDLMTIGNHEFDFGQETMNLRLSETKFPVINANTNFDNTPVEGVKPYEILNAGDLKFAFLGLIQLNNRSIPSTAPANVRGCRFRNGLDVAAEYLHLKDSANMLIALSHLGIQNDIKLAQKYNEFDLIIGGHSHSLVDSTLIVNDVLITQAEAYMQSAGKITLRFVNDSLIERKYEVVDLHKIENENTKIAALIEKYSTNPVLDEEIAHIDFQLNGKHEIGCVYTDAIKNELNLDIVFQNNGAIRKPTLGAGVITVADIYTLDPFSNEIIFFDMSADEIKSLIKFSYSMSNSVDLQVSGIKYTIKTGSDAELLDIILSDENGKQLAKSKIYKVGISNYVAEVYQFEHKDKGTPSGYTTTDVLIKYLRANKTIQQKPAERINVVEQI